MEKENTVAIAAFEAIGTADGVGQSEAPVIAAARVPAPVPAANGVKAPVPAGDEEDGCGKQLLDWDSYKEEPYVAPSNPYDTNIVDDRPEEDIDEVCSDVESFHTKARHVLRRLESGKLDGHWAGDVYMCPFCQRSIDTDFDNIMMHVESLETTSPKVRQKVNVYAFMAKHKAFRIHPHRLHNQAIQRGNIKPRKIKPPKIKGLGNKKERKRQRLEAMRRG